jgi:short subunit dehydrogenase-like uncharacterized protein
MQAGKGEPGRRRAVKMARNARWQDRLLGFPPVRWGLQRWVLPKPGDGPTAQQRENGNFEIVFAGQAPSLRAVVTGDRDPGYGSTARMLAQSALCLLHEADRSVTGGGVWTPGSAMGMLLVQRLHKHAGLTFEIESTAD